MRRQARDSYALVVRFWPLVLTAGILQAIVATGIWKHFAGPVFILPIVVLVVVIDIVLYGRILACILPGRPFDSVVILKENWINYLVVRLVIGMPKVLFHIVAAQLNTTTGQYKTLSVSLNALVVVLTVYAIPIVFLHRTRITAVLAGVPYLAQNLRASLWVVGSAIAALMVHAGGAMALSKRAAPWSYFGISIGGGLVSFLLFMSFAAATRVLLGLAGQESAGDA